LGRDHVVHETTHRGGLSTRAHFICPEKIHPKIVSTPRLAPEKLRKEVNIREKGRSKDHRQV